MFTSEEDTLKDASLIKFEFYVLPVLHYFFDVGQDNPIVSYKDTLSLCSCSA
jgi:hypothetical protein